MNPVKLVQTRWRELSVSALLLILIVAAAVQPRPESQRTTTPDTVLASVNTPSLLVDPTTTSTSTTTSTVAPSTTTTVPQWAVGNSGTFAVQPGGKLPTDADCAKQVTKTKEVKSANTTANHTTGNARAATVGNWGSNPIAAQYLQRVSGQYTGTTDEIIQWAACKWGFDPDTVRAQAMVESSWNQKSMGGYEAAPATCVDQSLRRIAPTTTTSLPTDHSDASASTTTSLVAPTTTLSATPPDGLLPTTTTSSTTPTSAGPVYECPTAFGLLQLRSDFQPGTYPMSAQSTAFNVDYALALERACYDGVSWQGSQTRGDVWGCLGMYYSGGWLDAPSKSYAASVQSALKTKAWTYF